MSLLVSHTVPNNSAVKTHALIAYFLIVVGLFTGVPIVIGGLWAMFTRRRALGTVYYSHYTNAIRTFWWTLGWTAVGMVLILLLVGYAVLGAVWLWALYRMINGFAKIIADEPYSKY